jgi:hypothetical protein
MSPVIYFGTLGGILLAGIAAVAWRYQRLSNPCNRRNPMITKPTPHSHREGGFALFEVLLATGVGLLLWLGWMNYQTQRFEESNALNRLTAENGAMLSHISRAMLANLAGEAPNLAANQTQWISLPTLNIAGLTNPPVTTFGTLWESCVWKDANNRPYGAVWETQSTGYPLSRTALKNAGAESLKPSHVSAFKYELARAASTEHSKDFLHAGIIPAGSTTFNWVQEGTVPITIPCLDAAQLSNDTRVAALITPEDIQRISSPRWTSITDFHPHELALTLNTASGSAVPMGNDQALVSQTVQGWGLTLTQDLLDRMVGMADNPTGHHGIAVVLVGGGGTAGYSDRNASAGTNYVAPGGGGGSGYVRSLVIPKERLQANDFLAFLVGTGGTPDAAAPNWAAGSLVALFAGSRGGNSCVRQYRGNQVIFEDCATGGNNGGAGNIWFDSAGTVQRTAPTGGNGGSGGGVGFPVSAQCDASFSSNYSDKCAFEKKFGPGGANGGNGMSGKNGSEYAVGLAGTGQGDTFLPLVDGIRFEGPARDDRRLLRLYEGDVLASDPFWPMMHTLDGVTVDATMREYKTGWADTGGYGLCFTRTPGRTAGLAALDSGCLSADAAGISPPNPLSVGRGYGAGGMSCWRRTAGGGPHNHCPDLPNAWPLTDAKASLGDLANGAAGAGYAYWLEK